MPLTQKPLPDAEAIAIAFLNDQAVLAGGVHSRIADDPTFPFATINLAPSTTAVERHLLAAALDVHAFGEKKADAFDAAAAVHAALWDRTFVGVSDGLGVVTGVEDRVGFQWLPDPDTNRPRYVFQVVVYVHALLT